MPRTQQMVEAQRSSTDRERGGYRSKTIGGVLTLGSLHPALGTLCSSPGKPGDAGGADVASVAPE